MNKDIIKFKYFNKDIYFLNKSIVYGTSNDKKQDCYVNSTGITTNRPYLIIDFLITNNIIINNSNILDIGCGCAEMGIEINRRGIKLNYTGLEIISELNNINKLNLPNYNFYNFDINYDKINFEKEYDIVMMMGCTEIFKIIPLSINKLDNKYKPKYVICESHINRENNLEVIIKNLNDYEIFNKYTFNVENKINYNGYEPSYKRIMYILRLKI